MTENIPLCKPAVGRKESNAVKNVIESGWLAHGQYNEEFEDKFADYIGTEYAISMNSCTSALHLAIKCNNITKEVLVPSFTFVASANAIVTAGATPVFVDIDPKTRNIDPDSVRDALSDDTEAIMPVHFGGQACDMDEILDIAKDYNLTIIEDSAESIGGEYRGKKTGTFGTGCFSLYPTKNITAGEGGVLTTNDEELANIVRAYVGHGITSTPNERENSDNSWYRSARYAGYNFRMSNIHAAIGLEQLRRIENLNSRRRSLARYLNDKLSDIEGVVTPMETQNTHHVYQMYTILVEEGIDREEVVRKLQNKGIGASVHFYPPVHQQPRYKNSTNVDLPNTEYVSQNIISLPMYPGLTEDHLETIIYSLKETLEVLEK